jgi:hypothetical protein
MRINGKLVVLSSILDCENSGINIQCKDKLHKQSGAGIIKFPKISLSS